MARAVDGTTQRALDILQAKIAADPDIQRVLAQERENLARTRDKGGDAGDYQTRVRDRITAIAEQKGYIPEKGQYFVNPNDGQLEPHGGWSGLSNKTRAAIIAAAAAGTAGAGLALAGSGAAAGTATGGGTLASSQLAMSPLYAGPVLGGAAGGGGGAVAGAAGAGGWLGNIWRNVGGARGAADLAGGVLGGISRDAAANRNAQFNAGYLREGLLTDRERLESERDRDFWNETLAREQEGRASGTDAWNKLRASQRVLSPAQRPQLSPYSVPARPATDTERTGASALSAEVMKRLEGGNPIAPPTRRPGLPPPDLDLDGPGWLERISGWAAPVATGIGILGRQPTGADPVSTKLSIPTTSAPQQSAPPPPIAVTPSFVDPNIDPYTGRPYNDPYDQYGRY